jgi:hypothetical protein
MELPTDYTKLSSKERKEVREQYVNEQDGLCPVCNESLDGSPRIDILNTKINLKLFPPGFLKNPIHLQHCHKTGMTEGAVHAKCNAVLWQYYGK